MKDNFKIKSKCRACNFTQLTDIFSFRNIVLSRFSKKSHKGIVFPLELVLCQKCHLLQLKHTVTCQLLFTNQYWYLSGTNTKMRQELTEIAQEAEMLKKLNTNDHVLDIGCNDGTLLRAYGQKMNLIGFEPAKNIAPLARKDTTKIINTFFSYKTCQKECGGVKFKVITAIAMFYDIDNPNQFIIDVKKILDEDGILIIQQNYLPNMLRNNAFDNIVHEHLTYYSLSTLEYILKMHSLEVFDVKLNDINGGSFRCYIKHKKSLRKINKRVQLLRENEERLKLDNVNSYKDFYDRINTNCLKLKIFVNNELERGKIIYAYGASTRGNTLLQFCRLDNQVIKKAAERNSNKWGLFTAGTQIPIISEQQARKEKPDYFLVLPWFYRDKIILREKVFIKNGGRLIFPLSQFEVYP